MNKFLQTTKEQTLTNKSAGLLQFSATFGFPMRREIITQIPPIPTKVQQCKGIWTSTNLKPKAPRKQPKTQITRTSKILGTTLATYVQHSVSFTKEKTT